MTQGLAFLRIHPQLGWSLVVLASCFGFFFPGLVTSNGHILDDFRNFGTLFIAGGGFCVLIAGFGRFASPHPLLCSAALGLCSCIMGIGVFLLFYAVSGG